MANDIKNQIKEVLFDITEQKFVFSNEAELVHLPGFDSLIMLQFIVAIEKRFGVSFNDSDIEKVFKNINSLALYLEHK